MLQFAIRVLYTVRMDICPLTPWLEKKKLRSADLARMLEAPRSAVSAYITGKRGLRLARFSKLATLTGIPLGELVQWSSQNAAVPASASKKTRLKRARH